MKELCSSATLHALNGSRSLSLMLFFQESFILPPPALGWRGFLVTELSFLMSLSNHFFSALDKLQQLYRRRSSGVLSLYMILKQTKKFFTQAGLKKYTVLIIFLRSVEKWWGFTFCKNVDSVLFSVRHPQHDPTKGSGCKISFLSLKVVWL